MVTGGRSHVAYYAIILLIIAGIAITTPIIFANTSSPTPGEISTTIEKKGTCFLTDADIREYHDHDFVMHVTSKVSTVNGVYVSYNKCYVLRVTFSENLDNGDIIRIYARYGTTPLIKAVLIENTNWEVVGGGEVYAMWGYYDLVITDLDVPRKSFDIALDPETPSSNSIRVDMVGCVCYEPHVEKWYDDDTGFVVANYDILITYVVTVTDIIDTSNVYLDLTFTQRVYNENNGSLIVETMIQKTTIKVPTVSEPHDFTTNTIPVIPRSIIYTDNITISIDVDAVARGMIKESTDWVEIGKMFDTVEELDLSWY
jgi:uncharacterized protein YneR